jgi:hypothetical protein
MAYIFCSHCRVGFHSNVHTCPQCGRVAGRTYGPNGHGHRRPWWRPMRRALPSDDSESQVRDAIYGWRSGTVEPLETHPGSP